VQPPADVLQRLAGVFDVSIDYLVNGNKSDKVEQTLKDAELIKQFKQLDKLMKRKNRFLKSLMPLSGILMPGRHMLFKKAPDFPRLLQFWNFFSVFVSVF